MIDLLTRASILRLRDRQYTVLEPGERVPTSLYDEADARGFLREHGNLVFREQSELVRVLRAAGYHVFRPAQLEAPKLGLYVPDRRRAPLALPRHLRCTLGNTVVYGLEPDAADVTIDLVSWHRWVQRVRARVET